MTFEEAHFRCEALTLISAPRLHVLYCLTRNALSLPGHIAEFGVYRGGSAHLIADVLHAFHSDKHFHLYDTFCGLPTPGPHDQHNAGTFSCPVDIVKANLKNTNYLFQIHIHPGEITPYSHVPTAFSLTHIDVDLYESTLCALHLSYPLTTPSGFILIDDYSFKSTQGAKLAVDEFCAANHIYPIILPAGQALLIKPHITS